MRIRVDLAYDGGGFHGWASQPGLRTVQGELQAALATALRTPDVQTVCAGRTDTGVHARGQVTHVDVDPAALAASVGRSVDPPLVALQRRVNGLLDADVRVRGMSEVPEAFDARFAALWRRYAYRIADDPASVDPLTRGHVLAWPRRLDVAAMDRAGAMLVGRHDFASFCKQRDGATTVRTLIELTCARTASGTIQARIVADAFCHHMVRSLLGCLVTVGEGRRPAEWAAEVLAARSRDGVPVLAAHGLTLEEVGYPPADQLAAQVARARSRRDP